MTMTNANACSMPPACELEYSRRNTGSGSKKRRAPTGGVSPVTTVTSAVVFAIGAFISGSNCCSTIAFTTPSPAASAHRSPFSVLRQRHPVSFEAQHSQPSSHGTQQQSCSLAASTTVPHPLSLTNHPPPFGLSSGTFDLFANDEATPRVAMDDCFDEQQRQQQQHVEFNPTPFLQSIFAPHLHYHNEAFSNTRLSSAAVAAIPSIASVGAEVAVDVAVDAYQRRKEEWARNYCSVDGLRRAFGSNHNYLWGDLDPSTTRRLYKTLLPKALLELYKVGVQPQDLAPLAYRARVAAKLYARERCALPARVAANLYDGFRQWRRYGSFNTAGMSYQQVWEKYSNMILEECRGEEGLTEQDVTARVCLKILERSCSTNEMVDRLVLSVEHSAEHRKDLQYIAEKLEQDVHKLLDPVFSDDDDCTHLSAEHCSVDLTHEECLRRKKVMSVQHFRTIRTLVRIKKRLGAITVSEDKQHQRRRLHREEEAASTRFPWQQVSQRSRQH